MALRALCAALALAAGTARAAPGREAEGRVREALLRGIEANFAGDYDRARELFEAVKEVDPTHPAREFYQATVLFWRGSADPSDPQHDAAIHGLLDASLAKARARQRRDAGDVEALHYLGLGYSYRGRLLAQRGRLYDGGVSGEKGRGFLEQGLALCERLPPGAPERATVCEDLRFPLGAYAYYAARLPGLLRMLSFLWFVPRGSREEGLAALERARERSGLHRLGAQSLLVSIHAHFEEEGAPVALRLARELNTRFPDNPFLDAELASHLDQAGDHAGAEAHALKVLAKVRAGLRNYGAATELAAELARAQALLGLGRFDEADAVLARLRAEPRFQHTAQTPRVSLVSGMLADLRGDRAGAKRFYQRCKDARGRTANRHAERLADRLLERPYDGSALR